MKKRLTAILLTIIFFCAATLHAQPYCTVRTFNIRDGLAANTISGIGQDNRQLMWFSTWNGLCCFDGYRFTTFRDTHGVDEVLTTNRLLMVVPNSEGNIWCATYDKRPYVFDTRQCQFVDVAKLVKEKYGIEMRARKFYTIGNGTTWIVGLDGHHIRIKDHADGGKYDMQLIGKDTPPLRSNNIRKVLADGKGREWVVTEKGTELFGQKTTSRYLFEILAQCHDKVYLASRDGHLAYYDEARRRLVPLRLPTGISRINSMTAINGRQVALATDKGIVSVSVANHPAALLSVQNPSQPSPEVTDLYVDSRKRLWAFGSGLGVSLVNTGTMSMTWVPELTPDSPHATTSQKIIWVEDKNHTLWITPNGGYFGYYDEQAKVIRPYILNGDRDNSHAYIDEIRKWYVDNQKNLWLTSSHDLTLVNLRTRKFKSIPQEKGKETRSACCDAYGYRYFGTTTGNVLVYDKLWTFRGYLSPTGKLSPTPAPLEGKVYALFADRQNRLWIGSKGGGLYVRYADGEMRHYMPDAADKYSINSDEIYAVDQDNQGNIWIGTYTHGLNLATVHADRTVSFRHSGNGMPRPAGNSYLRIRRITHTADGIVILSTTDGLVSFSNRFQSPARIRFYANTQVQGSATTLAGSDVVQALVAGNGKVYVATMSGGLQATDGGKNLLSDNIKFQTIDLPTAEEGIIQSLTEDRRGNIWITRESSIDMYNPHDGSIQLFGPNDFGENTEFSEALSATDGNGEIMVGVMGGAVAFNPARIKKSAYKPDIVFSAIQYQGETVPHPILYTDRLEIPSDKRSFTINFAALDYHDNSMVKYAYKLQGIDKEWNYLGNKNHSVSFSHFPTGNYKLLVRSTNADGVWVDNVEELSIYAQPTFWESAWAKLLYLLIALGVVYAGIHYYLLKHKAQMEHEMTEMKMRFFTEIGHKLRTPLTLIGGPVTEVLAKETLSEQGRRQMEIVRRNSRNMLELVNNMLEHNSDKNYFVDDSNAPVFMQAIEEEDTAAGNDAGSHDKSTRLLVVEDNDDLRAFLVSILSDRYTVLQAENGRKGLETTVKEMPDFIITDVMMPVMDGLTMIHQIKQNKDICHIPIIVLSAKASLDDKLQGLNEGIDDYITKPFSATYLRHRVENIIAQRRMLQQNYLDQLVPAAGQDDNGARRQEYRLEDVQIVDADKLMMDRLMAFLEENIGNADMKIEDLANAVNLGRTVFYEKMKSIVGMSPLDFLRHIRMQRAEELVAKSTETISQIAYSVGFTDPKYFGKCFKKETGMTPSEYREKAKADNS